MIQLLKVTLIKITLIQIDNFTQISYIISKAITS